MAGEDRQGRHRLRACRLLHRQLRPQDRRDGRARTFRSSRSSTSTSSPSRIRRSRSGRRRACRKWACCARRIPPGTCARRMAACCSAPTRRARRAAMSTGRRTSSEYELFQEDLERLMPHIETGDRARAGLRRGRHQEGLQRRHRLHAGRLADHRPGLGLKNFWLNEGHSFGVTAAGGAGWQLAEWIVDGEPTIDMMGVDPRRFGPYATEAISRRRTRKPTPTSSPCIIRTRSAPRRGR